MVFAVPYRLWFYSAMKMITIPIIKQFTCGDPEKTFECDRRCGFRGKFVEVRMREVWW